MCIGSGYGFHVKEQIEDVDEERDKHKTRPEAGRNRRKYILLHTVSEKNKKRSVRVDEVLTKIVGIEDENRDIRPKSLNIVSNF